MTNIRPLRNLILGLNLTTTMALTLAFVLTAFTSQPSHAQNFQVIHTFTCAQDGRAPEADARTDGRDGFHYTTSRSVWGLYLGPETHNRCNLELTLNRRQNLQPFQFLDASRDWTQHKYTLTNWKTTPWTGQIDEGRPPSSINESWIGGTGNWSTASDWNPSGIPNNGGGNTYNVTIDSGLTDLVSLDLNATLHTNTTINSLVVGGSNNGSTITSTLQNLAGTTENLTVTGATSIEGGGKINFGNNSTLSFGSLTVGGSSTGSSTLQNLPGSPVTLEVTGTTTIYDGGALTFGNASTLRFDGGLTVGGASQPYGGTFFLTGASATITGAGTFNYQSAVNVAGGSRLTVNGSLTNNTSGFSTGTTYGGGNTLTVNGGFTNSGTLAMCGSHCGGAGDTLNVTGTLTNDAAATLYLYDGSSDVANIGMLNNSGSVYIGRGSTLHLTNQPNGITDVAMGSALTVNGTLAAGSANGLAKLASVEGALTLANFQTTADTPGGGTLNVNAGGTLALTHPDTSLSVTGGLNDSGSIGMTNGAALSVTQGMTLNSGSTLNVAGGSTLTVNGNLTNNSRGFSTGTTYGGGNTLTVNGGFTNNGSFTMCGSHCGLAGDRLSVTGTLTNGAAASLYLYDNSGDVANIGTLSNSGSVYIGSGTTLHLTNQPNGITDVAMGSALTVNGTLTAGSANGLAKLASVEGALTLANLQTTADTPGGGTLSVASGGGLGLNQSGTSLSVTGGLNNSGAVTVYDGAALSVTQGMTLNSGSTLNVAGGSTLTVNGNLTNNSSGLSTGTTYGGGNTLAVNGGFTNNGSLAMCGSHCGGAGDTLNVTGTLDNGAAASLYLYDGSGDVANIGTLSNSGSVYIGSGTTLHLTNQPNGITDVAMGSALTVYGTLTAGSANGLAKLASVEGALTLANFQTTADTPGGGTLSVASGGGLGLNQSGTSLSVTGGLNNSGAVTVYDGAALSVTQGMTLNSGSTLNVAGGSTLTVNGNLTNNSSGLSTGTTYGGGNMLTVNGGFTNNGSLTMCGSHCGLAGDRLSVTGTLTNGAAASLYLYDNSGDVANIGTLSNSGSVYIGSGTTLHLTNQPNGITDVAMGSALTVNGTLTAGSANGLAKLASVEGALTLANLQTTADTPGGGTLSVASGGGLGLNQSGTSLSVTGGLNNSGAVTVYDGAALSVTQGMTLNAGSGLALAGGGTLTVNGNLTNNSNGFSTGLTYGGGDTVTVNGGFTNNGSLTMYGGSSAGTGDTLNVTGTLTNGAAATLTLVDYSGDVANVHRLNNSGTVNIDGFSTLNLTASGTDTNSGTINQGSSLGPGTLKISASAVTLSGSGSVIMSNLAGNLITAAASTDILTNASTIEGSGNIGNGRMGFVNTGTVLANQSTQLTIDPSSSGFNNNGTLNVSAGDKLRITGPANSFFNYSSGSQTLTGGTYLVSGLLQFDGANIVTNAANIVLNGTSSKIEDQHGNNALANFATNAAGGSFTISGGRNFTTAGNFTNNGTLSVASSNSKFTVNGNLSNYHSTTQTLMGGAYDVTGKLQFNDANIVTNAATIVLDGASSKIEDQHGNNALASFAMNASDSSFAISDGRNFTTAGNFTNNGTLSVASSNSKFTVNGNLANYDSASKTLTGGAYDLAGKLQFNDANIVTNAATIVLSGTSSRIQDQHGANGLANFATNASAGSFTLNGGQTFTTRASFTNQGTFVIGSGSTFTVGGSGNYTQSSGSTMDDGTLALSSTGALNLNSGSLFGKGTISGALLSSATVSPGDSSTTTGILTDSGAYMQHSSGTLDVSIAGTTAGSKYDQLKTTTASLNGALSIHLINGFVPAIGNTFKIVTFNSGSGMFSTVTGLSINSSEHFSISYQGSDVLLTVVSGPEHGSATAGGSRLGQSDMSSTNLGNNFHNGFANSMPGLAAARSTSASAVNFQAASASVMASTSSARQPASFSLAQSRSSITNFAQLRPVISNFAAPPSGVRRSTSSATRFPNQVASGSHGLSSNNGAYGLRNRSVGGGFAFPMGHLSKPQPGLLVE